jgi:predicted glycosyltransferase
VTELDPEATALVVTGSAAIGSFEIPARVDTVKLPVFRREADGTLYAASLGVDMSTIESLRSEILCATARAFDPDVVVIDKTPLGLRGELVPMLEWLRNRGRAQIVLGLRNVEDEPARVRAAWSENNTVAALKHYYDRVIIYGPESTTGDALSCLDGVQVPVPVTHVGIVGNAPATTGPSDLPDDYLLVTVGGGSDGHDLITAVLDAEEHAPLPMPVVVVTGPLMPAPAVAEIAARCNDERVRLFEFRQDMPLVIAGARAVVTMGGYNTVSEVLQSGVPCLIVPRVRPSAEQLIRANDLAAAGLVDMMHPDDITPQRMWTAIITTTQRECRRVDRDEYRGAEHTASLLQSLTLGVSRRIPCLA